MKVSVLIIAGIVAFASCGGNDVKTAATTNKAATDTANYTSIQWIDSLKDIGEVEAGKVAEIKFRFRNTGEKPLFIISAQPGCGCTVADYPKEAIAPGAEGVIKANYDVKKGATGDFRKSITVTTNTRGNNSAFIFFFGKVKKEGENTANGSNSPTQTDSTRGIKKTNS